MLTLKGKPVREVGEDGEEGNLDPGIQAPVINGQEGIMAVQDIVYS
jgi:hypothetical protein